MKRDFDIISISWTIQKYQRNKNGKHLARLEDALGQAAKKDILVFCSAPDIGKAAMSTFGNHYPFGCATLSQSIFKIGAARADGSIYEQTGNYDDVHFIFPGHHIQYRENDSIEVDDSMPRTGSSVATALAAGLAALIIHCVRLGAIYHHYRKGDRKGNDPLVITEATLRAIKKIQPMRDVFTLLSQGHSKENRRVEVEARFKSYNLEPGVDRSSDSNSKWQRIASIARDLVQSDTQARYGS